MAVESSGFVWTPAARRSVNVLVAMQAMHMAGDQVVLLASEDLLVEMLQDKARHAKDLLASLREQLDSAGDSEEAQGDARQKFEEAIKIQANSRAAHIMSTIQVMPTANRSATRPSLSYNAAVTSPILLNCIMHGI